MNKINKEYYNNLLNRKLYLQPDSSIVSYDYIKLNSFKKSYNFFHCESTEECVHKLITDFEKDLECFLSILSNLFNDLKINTCSKTNNNKINNILDTSIHNIINIIHEVEDLNEFESFLIKILNKDVVLNDYGNKLIISSSLLIDIYYELLLLSINRIVFLENYENNCKYSSKNVYSQISRIDEGMGYKGNKGPYNHMPGPYSNFDMPYDRVSPAHQWGENDGHAHLKFKAFIQKFKRQKRPVTTHLSEEYSASLIFNPNKRRRKKNKINISQNGRLGHPSTNPDPAKHVWYHGENNPYLWSKPENNTYKSWRNYAY